ncbi:MAG: Holliday junction resolvase RuvX [Cytophagales bacterium]|nr:MAG: Holliday junction resolvase RuvX [Cytophagales bacterium]
MGRILALDMGTKRTGIAVTDSLKLIANSLTTIDSKNIILFLTDYFSKETVETLVIGMPVDLNGRNTDSTNFVKTYAKKISIAFPDLKIEFYDERFTSKMALQTLVSAGTTKKFRRDKGNIDKISANIILSDWMQFNNL